MLLLNRNTINRYYRIFRAAIYRKQQHDKLFFFGAVELDETSFGSKPLRGINMLQKRGRGAWKQPVFGVFERARSVYTEVVPDAKQSTLRKIIKGR